MDHKTKTNFKTIETLAPIVMIMERKNAAAIEEQMHAKRELLDAVVALVKPALRALGSRPVVASSVVVDSGVPRTQTHAEWRGVNVGSVTPPQPIAVAEGSYAGDDLFLAHDGTWRLLTYTGQWSHTSKARSHWEATEKTLTTEQVANAYGAEEIVTLIAQAIEQVAAGKLNMRTKQIATQAAKIRAVVTLLGDDS